MQSRGLAVFKSDPGWEQGRCGRRAAGMAGTHGELVIAARPAAAIASTELTSPERHKQASM